MDMVITRLFPNVGLPFLESVRGTGSMERDWDNRAKIGAQISVTGTASVEEEQAQARLNLDNRILQGINLNKGSVVLEIGCGLGTYLKLFSGRVKEVHGVDISGEMLKKAKERLRDCSNVFLYKTEGQLDMFPNRHFDFVYSVGVFQHFPSKHLVYGYFRDTSRVLKVGGEFAFHVDGRYYLKWRRIKGGTARGVVFSPAEVRENLEKYGFQINNIREENTIGMIVSGVLVKDHKLEV